MKPAIRISILLAAVLLVVTLAPAARAQSPKVEIGTSLTSVSIDFSSGNSTSATLGIPGSGSLSPSPGLFASLFVTPQLAIEPQIGLVATSGSGSGHLLTAAGQVDYFFKPANVKSAFIFGSAGFLHATGLGVTPASFSGGIGYRWVFADRLAVRLDGRFTHFTQDLGNEIGFKVSLGGLFGRR